MHGVVVVLLVSAVVSLASPVVLGDVGYDRPFGDLPSMPIHLPSGSTAATCAALCNKTNGMID